MATGGCGERPRARFLSMAPWQSRLKVTGGQLCACSVKPRLTRFYFNFTETHLIHTLLVTSEGRRCLCLLTRKQGHRGESRARPQRAERPRKLCSPRPASPLPAEHGSCASVSALFPAQCLLSCERWASEQMIHPWRSYSNSKPSLQQTHKSC